jgi:hypothetical protein
MDKYPEKIEQDHSEEKVELSGISDEIIKPELAEVLNKIKEDPDVKNATESYLEENLKNLDYIEELLNLLEIVNSHNEKDCQVKLPGSKESIAEMAQEIISKIKNNEIYKRSEEKRLETELEQNVREKFENAYDEMYKSGTIDSKDVENLAKILNIKYSKIKLSINKKYKMELLDEIKQAWIEKENEFKSHRYELSSKDRKTEELIRNNFKSFDLLFSWPDYDLNNLSSFQDLANDETKKYQEQVVNQILNDEALIKNISTLPDEKINIILTDLISKGLENSGIKVDDKTHLRDTIIISERIKVDYNLEAPGTLTESIKKSISARCKSLFRESSLPSYYASHDRWLVNRLNNVSLRVSNGTAEEIDLVGQLKETLGIFKESIDRSSDLYWHATPVLGRIIESGRLSPRANVPEELRYTNTGEHSKAVHFGREGLEDLYFNHYSTSKKIDSMRHEDTNEGFVAVVVPLLTIVKHSPFRRETASKLPSLESNPTARKYRSQDAIFFSGDINNEPYNYDYPLSECYIVITPARKEKTVKELEAAGYTEEWIENHLIVVLKPTNQTEGPRTNYQTREKIEKYMPNALDIIESEASHKIKKQIEASPVMPLRVFSMKTEAEHTDYHSNARSRVDKKGVEREVRQTRGNNNELLYLLEYLKAF